MSLTCYKNKLRNLDNKNKNLNSKNRRLELIAEILNDQNDVCEQRENRCK